MVHISSALVVAAVATATLVSAHEGHAESGSNSTGGHAEAGACAANVSASVIAVMENTTFFNTCAKGSTFKFTSLLDALKLPATDFFQFCNSSACLGPMHTVMHDAPLTCLITYKGKAQNLTGEITELHDKCHEVKDAAKAKAAGSSASKNASSNPSSASSNASATTPAPTTSAAATSVSSKTLAVAIAGCATIASLLL